MVLYPYRCNTQQNHLVLLLMGFCSFTLPFVFKNASYFREFYIHAEEPLLCYFSQNIFPLLRHTFCQVCLIISNLSNYIWFIWYLALDLFSIIFRSAYIHKLLCTWRVCLSVQPSLYTIDRRHAKECYLKTHKSYPFIIYTLLYIWLYTFLSSRLIYHNYLLILTTNLFLKNSIEELYTKIWEDSVTKTRSNTHHIEWGKLQKLELLPVLRCLPIFSVITNLCMLQHQNQSLPPNKKKIRYFMSLLICLKWVKVWRS